MDVKSVQIFRAVARMTYIILPQNRVELDLGIFGDAFR